MASDGCFHFAACYKVIVKENSIVIFHFTKLCDVLESYVFQTCLSLSLAAGGKPSFSLHYDPVPTVFRPVFDVL